MPEAPRELCGLTALRSLSLTNNRIKSLSAGRIHLLPNLRSLDLSTNGLTGRVFFGGGGGKA
jgi:Leucine-rich repeat (LRR) protein